MSFSTLPVFTYQPLLPDDIESSGEAVRQPQFTLHAERREGAFGLARRSNDKPAQTSNRLASAGLTWRFNLAPS